MHTDKNILKQYLEEEEAAAVMYTFADQEKEFNKALRNERRRGEARGEIKGAIRLYHEEMHLQPKIIIEKIITRFNLPREDAEKYVEETLGLELV